MKTVGVLLSFVLMFGLAASSVSAFCLFGFIGDCSEEEFFTTDPVEDNDVGEVIPIQEDLSVDEIVEEELIQVSEEERSEVDIVIQAREGDLIDLLPVAIDPDGDEITYTFSEPFNVNGMWQSQRGESGKYLVTITASDGDLSTSENLLLVLQPANKIPIVECPEKIVVTEGQTVELDCNVFDPDDDSLLIEYSGWMDSKTRTTTFSDAGVYTVQVRARDAENSAEAQALIEVVNKNRAPSLSGLNDIVAMETDVIVLNPEVIDEDGDLVQLQYSEPFNEQGIFRTGDGDSGEYKITVTASDGTETIKESINLVIEDVNTAPRFENLQRIVEVEETDLVDLNINVFDPEGDEVVIAFGGWMEAETKRTTFEDAGTYTVDITISDGQLSNTETITVNVRNKNRAPAFQVPA